MNEKRAESSLGHDLLLYCVFFAYAIIMLSLLFFRSDSVTSVNLIPMKTVYLYLAGKQPMALTNLLGNTILFIPLGAYIALFRRGGSFARTLTIVLCVLSGVELAQYILQVGAADIDDVILNTLGALVGVGLYRLLERLFAERARHVFEWSAFVIGTVFVILFVCLWTGVFGIYFRVI